jgi:hypothetical protein
MKKLLALMLTILLLFSLSFSFVACGKSEPKEISCEDIIAAYENAGYYVVHGEHKTDADSSQLCYIKASLSEDSDSHYIYFITCFTEEQAQKAAETDQYNLAVWLYAAISGESRWLKTGTYGKIEYSYYNTKLIKPFNKLIK